MRLERVRRIPGYVPLCVRGDVLLLARRHELHVTDVRGGAIRRVCSLPDTPMGRTTSMLRITRRLLRRGMHCGAALDDARFVVSFRSGLYCIDIERGTWVLERDTSDGFRPFTIARISGVPGFQDALYYGEYDGRITHAPIRIFRRDPSGWRVVHTFPAREVDHVHALVPDPERECVWILTGDYGQAPGIWMARDDFAEVRPILRGEQAYRTCALFPMKDGLLYATDSHLEKNSLRWLERNGDRWRTRSLRPMVGSCVHACRVGERYFFATAVEPGPPSGRLVRDLLEVRPGAGIAEPVCEIVGGSLAEGFETLVRWRADPLPKRLFQFSVIAFPSGSPEDDVLVTYGSGVLGHDDTTEVHAICS